MTPKGQRVFSGQSDLLYDHKGHEDHLLSIWHSLWTQKVTGSFEVAVTYFMTPKVTVTFVVGLTYFMTPKGYGVIRGRHELRYDPKGHGDLCGRFYPVYDPKRSRGH